MLGVIEQAPDRLPRRGLTQRADEAVVAQAPGHIFQRPEMVTGPVRQLPIDWEVRSVRSGHWPMVTRPDELTDVLREAAEATVAEPQSMATMR